MERNESNTTVKAGVGLAELTFLVFLVLKLIGVIDWSWWWITAPLWIPVIFVIVLFAIFTIMYFIAKK